MPPLPPEIATAAFDDSAPSMDLRQLTTFLAAARAGSFAQAALDLSYAPSTVTEQVRALETSVGAVLFERRGRGVALTDAGRRLLPYAERFADLADEARSAVAPGRAATGTVAVGALETICSFRLPRVLAALRRTSPGLRVSARAGTRPELQRALEDGAIDVALTLGDPLDAPQVVSEALAAEPLALVVAPDHPLAGRDAVDDADLGGETLLVTAVGCSFRALVDRAFAGRAERPAYGGDLPTVGALQRCVQEGMGVALLPEVAVAGELARGELVALAWRPADDPPVLRLSWSAAARDTHARRAVLDRIRMELGAPLRARAASASPA